MTIILTFAALKDKTWKSIRQRNCRYTVIMVQLGGWWKCITPQKMLFIMKLLLLKYDIFFCFK